MELVKNIWTYLIMYTILNFITEVISKENTSPNKNLVTENIRLKNVLKRSPIESGSTQKP